MTGPEHYREAETQLELAAGSEGGSHTERYALAAAQVHATLAVAAAMIAAPFVNEGNTGDEWLTVTSGGAAEAGESR
jgi:hypothetical protein